MVSCDGTRMLETEVLQQLKLLQRTGILLGHCSTKPWRTLPGPPLKGSAAITIHGALLAVGGCRHGNERSTAIHVYQPVTTDSWRKVGDLPSPLSHCACTLQPSSELLVAGGYDSKGKLTARIDVAVMNEWMNEWNIYLSDTSVMWRTSFPEHLPTWERVLTRFFVDVLFACNFLSIIFWIFVWRILFWIIIIIILFESEAITKCEITVINSNKARNY